MQRFRLANYLLLLTVCALVLCGAGACGTVETPEPEATPPPPTAEVLVAPATATTEVFESPLATPVPSELILDPGAGGARGRITAFPESWQGSALLVYFAPFYAGEKEDEGIFVLEPGTHPYVEASPEGVFQLGSIPAGKYVIVIGPGPERAVAIQDGDQPRVFEIVEGEVLDLGEIDLQQ